MFNSFACIHYRATGKGLLPDTTRMRAIEAACELYKVKTERLAFRGDDCEGIISSKWQGHRVGAIYGVMFTAYLNHEEGEHRFDFLLSESDLEYGASQLGDENQLSVIGEDDMDDVLRAEMELAILRHEGGSAN